MNAQWQAFLETYNARIQDGSVVGFERNSTAALSALSSDILSDLSHEALIRVNGPDAYEFLQGQLSTDVHAVNRNTSQLSAYHSPQGRVLAVLRLFADENGLYLALPMAMRETVQKRLSMFVLRAKVTLEDVSTSLVSFGIAGFRAPKLLAEAGRPVPAGANEVCADGEVSIVRLPGELARFQCYGSATMLESSWRALAEHVVPVGRAEWSLRTILAGVPIIYPATQDHFLPQMLNLHEFNAIDFKKGCYTGQEVIARLQYRGTLKRRLILAYARTDTTIAPGEMLHVAGEEQPAGEVVEAELHPDGGLALLAVVRATVFERVLARQAVLKIGVYGIEVERVGEAPAPSHI